MRRILVPHHTDKFNFSWKFPQHNYVAPQVAAKSFAKGAHLPDHLSFKLPSDCRTVSVAQKWWSTFDTCCFLDVSYLLMRQPGRSGPEPAEVDDEARRHSSVVGD